MLQLDFSQFEESLIAYIFLDDRPFHIGRHLAQYLQN
jgi:hypothetical protein